MKIAIIDDGIDQTHPFFNPAGFTYPAGLPAREHELHDAEGDRRPRVPVPVDDLEVRGLPFDPQYSEHATHVSGIAAGDYNTVATGARGRVLVSGIAPKAYLGNYKALTVPTQDYGLDGNSPEIAKAIDQAVADGMNVINLSLGEPEIEPARDIVVQALDNAAAAGVVPVVAAGNDYGEAGHGSIGSPGNAPDAISVAASSEGGGSQPADEIASFSSGGPTPISLQLKPDVTAPGENILSSIPHASWDCWDGTSMATPHVAGAAALLKQRHPTWTVEQVKSALESTGDAVHAAGTADRGAVDARGRRPDRPRPGRHAARLHRSGEPLVRPRPPRHRRHEAARRHRRGRRTRPLGGHGRPAVARRPARRSRPTRRRGHPGRRSPSRSPSPPTRPEGSATGFLVLTRGTDVRRIPFWFRVENAAARKRPAPDALEAGPLHRRHARQGSRSSRTYRYPDRGSPPASRPT